MLLRGRVGRHNDTGRQCQNWADDQHSVRYLLNAIPILQGGAAGSLAGHIVMGIASDALCQAILRFEDKHFPDQRSGFVDPGGAMWERMLIVWAQLPSNHAGLHVVKVIDKASPQFFE